MSSFDHGRAARRADVRIDANPYTIQPDSTEWEWGWKAEHYLILHEEAQKAGAA